MSGEVRVGDAERERAAEALADHYAAGRLDHAEYVERLDAIWTARTRADLDMLFHDLPRAARPEPASRSRRSGPPFPLIALAVLVVGVVVLTHLPIVLLLLVGVVLFKVARRRSQACLGPRRSAAARW
jgi:hypothetical protein